MTGLGLRVLNRARSIWIGRVADWPVRDGLVLPDVVDRPAARDTASFRSRSFCRSPGRTFAPW
jgi:hypothetical protein